MSRALDFDNTSTADLFATYRGILRTLRERGIIRTDNAPTGDYAEYLAAKLLNGTLADNSEKSYDVDADDQRYQVKSRVVDGAGRGKLQLPPVRSWGFDHALVVLFHDDYTVRRATLLPQPVVEAHASYRKHVNGYVLHATDTLLDHPDAQDATTDLQAVAGE